jgi:5-methylcytosine-specific restriction endonuclease McrA
VGKPFASVGSITGEILSLMSRLISNIYSMGGPYVAPSSPRKKRGASVPAMARSVRKYLISKRVLRSGPCQSFIEIAEACIIHFDLPLNTSPVSKQSAKKIISDAYCKIPASFSPKEKSKTTRVRKARAKKTGYQERVAFYDSDAWRALRYEALKAYGRRCMVCGATPEIGAQLHVDHIKPRSLYPELELVLGNLQILCRDCNLGKSNKDSIDWRQATEKVS